MRLGSLFAGIGGFDLAARWVGWSTAWFSEVDPFCCRVMAERFPDARALGDITQIDFRAVESVDVLAGGFPCQDVSQAGKRAGIRGAKSGLWRDFARSIGDLRPRYVVVENASGLLARGIGTVLGDLAALGYGAEWETLPAAAFGAPHLRNRVWIVAYADGGGREVFRLAEFGRLKGAPWGKPDGRGPLREFVDTPRGEGWGFEPEMDRVVNGFPGRVAQVGALGNAIVPQCAAAIFRAIAALEA